MPIAIYRLQLRSSGHAGVPSRPSVVLLELTHRHDSLQPVLVRALSDRRFENHQVPLEMLAGVDDEAALETPWQPPTG